MSTQNLYRNVHSKSMYLNKVIFKKGHVTIGYKYLRINCKVKVIYNFSCNTT